MAKNLGSIDHWSVNGAETNAPATIANHIVIENTLLAAAVAPALRFVFRDNIADHGTYGIKGAGSGDGNSTLQTWFPSSTFSENVLIGADSSAYPANNYFPVNDYLRMCSRSLTVRRSIKPTDQ